MFSIGLIQEFTSFVVDSPLRRLPKNNELMDQGSAPDT